jgi:hypothetical protein
MFKPTTVNDIIHELGDLMYVILSMAEKHMPCEEFIGTTKYLTLEMRCRTNRCRYNEVQLHIQTT